MMKVSEIKNIIGCKHLSKSKGQTLLIDENIAEKIANAASELAENRILEIGPGLGIISRYLIEEGLHVLAVEIDSDFCSYLEKLDLNVINDDFLRLEIDNSYPEAAVGALPFSMSVKIVLKLKDYRQYIKNWIVVMQDEVTDRLIADPGTKSYSSISVLFQVLYRMEKLFTINPDSFFPRPEVKSSVLKAMIRENPGIEVDRGFERFLKELCRFRRKMIKNNLIDYDLSKVEISPKKRAENLSPKEIIELYQQVERKG